MINPELARIFYEMADILEMQGVAWKPIAYRKAARSIETLEKDIAQTYREKGLKGLKEISGVGEGIAKKIEQYIKTNQVAEYEKLRKTIPSGVEEMMHIPGMGPKKAFRLYTELKIKSLQELESAAKSGKIRKMEGFGARSEQDILRGIELAKTGQERILLGNVLPVARKLVEKLQALKEVKKIEIGGSTRRMKETCKDIDILVISKNPKKIMDFFTSLEDVRHVLAKGSTKSSVVLKQYGLNADIRVLEPKSFGAALQYFTGSKDHNIKLRQIAIKKGYKLSEYGLFRAKTDKYICGKTEGEIYKKLGLKYIKPEMRENTGEIESAKKNRLPKLIQYNSIKGDLHMHTAWSDGSHSTEQMIKASINMHHKYIAITDHSQSERIAHGLDKKRLLKHLKEIDVLQKKYKKIRIFKGAEVDILADGTLDYHDNVLKNLDIVVASIHSRFKSSKEEMTKRILKAMDNPNVKILGHPTGRLINERLPYQVDVDAVFKKAKEKRIALEINAFPSRLDLSDSLSKKAVEMGVKLVISTDSHSTEHLRFMELGIAQARRGWAESKDVLNTLSLNKFKKFMRIK